MSEPELSAAKRLRVERVRAAAESDANVVLFFSLPRIFKDAPQVLLVPGVIDPGFGLVGGSAIADGDVCAFIRKRAGAGGTDAARSAGDEGNLACE